MNEASQTMNVEKKTIRSDIPHTRHAAPQAEDCPRMVVGRGMIVNGNISACDHLIVEGTVEAEGFRARRLEIADTGLFAGSAEVLDAVISGRFEGRLTVTGRLVVKATARITGEIEYAILETEAGARIDGRMSAIAVATPVAVKEEKKPQAEPTPSNVEHLFDETEATTASRSRVFRRAG